LVGVFLCEPGHGGLETFLAGVEPVEEDLFLEEPFAPYATRAIVRVGRVFQETPVETALVKIVEVVELTTGPCDGGTLSVELLTIHF
jgi:hypothetical protein